MPPRKQVGAAQRVGYPARAPSASAMCRHASRCGVERGRCRTTRRTERTTWTPSFSSRSRSHVTWLRAHAVRAARNRSWVRLFFVGGPRGFCQRHGKSYLTRRRCGGEGGGGGLLTGRAIPSAYRWAWCRWYSRVVEVPVRIEVAAGFVAPGASEPPRLQPSSPPGGSGPAHG